MATSHQTIAQESLIALGTHTLAEIHGASASVLDDPAVLEKLLIDAAVTEGATVVESSFNPFSPHGVTGVVVIQESHLALHTWPESGYAALDVFTCSQTVSPDAIAQRFADSIEATRCDLQTVLRGVGVSEVADRAASAGAAKRSVWFTDRQDNIAVSLRHAGLQYSEQSPYQKVEVVASEDYGKILLLNDRVAFTERDEFAYHELISHVPLSFHENPRNVLVIGGGDGGACREFLKHPTIESIAVVEIDPTVTEAARAHFPAMSQSLDDDRVEIMHGDGQVFLESAANAYDVIVVDFLDTASDVDHADSGLAALQSALRPEGIAVAQVCPPTLSPERFGSTVRSLRGTFDHVLPYVGFLPTFSTGMISFALCSQIERAPSSAHLASQGLKYLNDEVLRSAFALPTFAKQLIEE